MLGVVVVFVTRRLRRRRLRRNTSAKVIKNSVRVL